MTYTIEMHSRPDVTEEEVRRRLAACYSLLLKLAWKRKGETPGDDNMPLAGTPGDSLATECQELDRVESESGTGE